MYVIIFIHRAVVILVYFYALCIVSLTNNLTFHPQPTSLSFHCHVLVVPVFGVQNLIPNHKVQKAAYFHLSLSLSLSDNNKLVNTKSSAQIIEMTVEKL
jgi:hypothetical protein